MYNFDECPDRVRERARKWDRKIIEKNFGKVPEGFIPMWIADMDFKMPPELEQALRAAIGRGALGYTYCYDEFYEAVMRWQGDRHGATVEKEWITLSYGTVSTLHYVIQAFCGPEDCVLMNTPVYEPFDSAARRQGVKRIYNSLQLREGRYTINFTALKAQLEQYKPQLYLFCSPHNPSGRIWSFEEMKTVARLCREHDTILVADEVHGEHIHQGKFHSALMLKEAHSNLILLTSPNKGFNLGGLKTSYSIIPDEKLRTRLRQKLEQNSVTSPNVFGIIGLIAAYDRCRPWLDEAAAYIRENYELFASYIAAKIPQLQVMEMEASYLAWVDIRRTGLSSGEVTRVLASRAGALVENGAHFVRDGEGYIRVNLGTQRDNVLAVLKKMEEVLNQPPGR
ncbi:aminotransferase class i/classii [Lucifera butyrica]|uniref:cysteine-S-conjugate beta-lyase n=1 Tax=Lucifera butyrica TaxID=1351585 RepID=A0A498RF80_9FIRM|nr:PatB family C-S lyase [Lucifera butyrica]VBB09607.1 aminotransferase class i/classii [Lucifera butyrica]